MNNRQLYTRFVLANAVAEMVGLGTTLYIDFLIISRTGEPSNWGQVLLTIPLFALTGAIEGTLVGLAQGWVLRLRFNWLHLRDWVIATNIGAILAWFLGSLPSTWLGMGQADSAGTAVQEPPQAVVLLLAAGMGAVLGVVLSYFQWRVLRKVVINAGWWIPANSLAWAAGMPVIFAVMDFIQADTSTLQIAMTLAAALFIAGAVVGAIEGIAVIRFKEKEAVAPAAAVPAR